MKTFIRTIVALTLLLTFAAVRFPNTASAEEANTATPASGPIGTTFTFSLHGFDGDERVGYWLTEPNGTVVKLDDRGKEADDGVFTYSWTARAGLPDGYWLFVGKGIESDVQQQVAFEITGGSALPDDSYNVDPTVGPAGTTFAFYATGFDGDEIVGLWLNAPDGTVVKLDDSSEQANGDGRVDVHIGTPTTIATGNWQLVLQGSTSGVQQVINFTIQ